MTGPGEVEWGTDGIHLRATVPERNLDRVFGTVGFLVGMAITLPIYISEGVKRHSPMSYLLFVGVVVVTFTSVWLGQRLFRSRVRHFFVPWDKVANVSVDRGLVTLVSKAKPDDGQVWFDAPDPALVVERLEAARPARAGQLGG